MKQVTWLFTDEQLNENDIIAMETSLGVKFPKDYKNCIKKYNGGYPEPNIYYFNDGGEGIFESLLSFTSEDANIEVVYELTSLPENIIPFARDPFGGLICFDYRPNKEVPVIVFFDEESDNNIKFICESFSELINRLLIIE